MLLQSILIGLLIFLAIMIGILLILGARAKAKLKARHSPPGQMIDVGGYRLHIDCQGKDGPSVVMDAGVGEYGLSWDLVQPEAAKFTRACVYDRAGLGWSEPSPKPRTNLVMVDELRNLLRNAGIPAPYILVGASLGGLNARLYAHQYPEEVAGLVLVDAAHEGQYTSEGMRQSFESILKMMPKMLGMLRLLTQTGLPILLPQAFKKMVPLSPKLSEQTAEAIYALRFMHARYFSTAQAEMASIPESHAQIRDMQITSLGDIPIIVIQHGKYEQMQTPELTEMNEQTNRRQQALLAGQSSRGKLVVAEESGHAIQYEQPEVVIEAILEVVKAVSATRELIIA
ncbi:MAG TPA: alpha/beta hydrolase [Anaerolineales bacterium]